MPFYAHLAAPLKVLNLDPFLRKTSPSLLYKERETGCRIVWRRHTLVAAHSSALYEMPFAVNARDSHMGNYHGSIHPPLHGMKEGGGFLG